MEIYIDNELVDLVFVNLYDFCVIDLGGYFFLELFICFNFCYFFYDEIFSFLG